MVARVRLELTTYRVWTDCSSQLSYLAIMVGMTGFEPATPWSQIKYTTKLCYIPNGAPSRSRTRNLLGRNQALCPIELRAHLEPPTGFEPVIKVLQTYALAVWLWWQHGRLRIYYNIFLFKILNYWIYIVIKNGWKFHTNLYINLL